MNTGANTRSGTLPVALGAGVPVVAISRSRDGRPVRRRRQRAVRGRPRRSVVRQGGLADLRRSRARRSAVRGRTAALRRASSPGRASSTASSPRWTETSSGGRRRVDRRRAGGLRPGRDATCGLGARVSDATSARMKPQPMKYSACQTWSKTRFPIIVSDGVRERGTGGPATARPLQDLVGANRAHHQAELARSRPAGIRSARARSGGAGPRPPPPTSSRCRSDTRAFCCIPVPTPSIG